MGKFLSYLLEGETPLVTEFNIQTVDLNNEETLLAINTAIAQQTDDSFITPYLALGRVMTILAQYSIHLPKMFLDKDSGKEHVEVLQFGLEQDESYVKKYFYMEYILNESGYFDVFCQIVDELDLSELYGDDDLDSLELSNTEE